MADTTNTITFEIVDELGVLSTYESGWKKELNLVSWNGAKAKYDIRDWDPAHQRMSRGITFTEKEMTAIVDFFSGHQFAKDLEEK